jgi:hypothetical protein
MRLVTKRENGKRMTCLSIDLCEAPKHTVGAFPPLKRIGRVREFLRKAGSRRQTLRKSVAGSIPSPSGTIEKARCFPVGGN